MEINRCTIEEVLYHASRNCCAGPRIARVITLYGTLPRSHACAEKFLATLTVINDGNYLSIADGSSPLLWPVVLEPPSLL